jgi:uncharacterized membrane protein YqjE
LRTLADSLVGSVHDRLELLGVEVQEEKFRLVQSLLWISAAVFAGAMMLGFASLVLVYLFWDGARLAVLGGLTLFYATMLTAVVIGFNRWRALQPKPFAGSLQELKDDRSCIRGQN